MTSFRRRGDHPIADQLFRLLIRRAEEKNVHLSQAFTNEELTRGLRDELARARSPIRLHGSRAEEMFSYLAASLGAAVLIKREDAGDLWAASDTELSIPDYRLVLRSGEQILVEVKNFNVAPPDKGLRFKTTYLQQLKAYGDLFAAPVYCAVYWARWRLWTMHRIDNLLKASTGDHVEISLLQALQYSEIKELGDVMFGTVYPLKLTLRVDADLIRKRGRKAQYRMTIRDVTIHSGDSEIKNDRDKSIAFGFILHGRWRSAEPELIGMEDRVTAIEFLFMPEEHDPDHPFAIIGSLSSLANAHFSDGTTDSRGVRRLRLDKVPASPYPKLGEGYHGTDLSLWCFVQEPAEPMFEAKA